MQYKSVQIAWLDEPDRAITTLVGIGEWNEDLDDDRIFFYFADEDEYQLAKLPSGINDFRIINEEEN
jgi:hypothetical protein